MKNRAARMFNVLKSFRRDESGATVIEYTLIASIICIGIIGSVGTLGTTAEALYTSVANQVAQATN
ncbi:Flp family type IVb pilin [Phyllobacterium sp. 21LDTY02-6]|jgi:pilus assembly protein Flp/PilA|uniref:Flp family type IVb pilin n=1 Tax=unclassified Phyllobacterium TaxID=2638441 RepID=UPI002020ED83|nr:MULTISPECIES: Flp family type IVb pilin [unclassified Phyllobacterium]MCO4316863.1 Flp family type IVb pilin [Phyllobacterium sp. 21LDTY02-6]MCX8281856.1 Flp family type IVb pilin [Phyllobacterium sp. 0TCS1.6C]MCX8295391.1 Flp family type IVb pilin [Phyllobacterium sp. 0TCS1.6A]